MVMASHFYLTYILLVITAPWLSLSSTESDLTLNDSESSTDSVSAAEAAKNADEAFRQMVNKLPGIPLGRLPGTSNMREEVQKFREYLRNRPNPNDWQMLTPAPPDHPNCYVEVQVTKKIPGKCIKLGGRIPACQASDVVNIDYTNC